MSEVSETSEKILQYEPTAMVLHQPIPRPSQSFNFVTKVSISSPRLYFTMNQIMPESSDLKIEQFRGLSACPHIKNTWIMRMSFTAFWKTNNHSSSCTQQTEHHIIYLYNICIVKYKYKILILLDDLFTCINFGILVLSLSTQSLVLDSKLLN